MHTIMRRFFLTFFRLLHANDNREKKVDSSVCEGGRVLRATRPVMTGSS